MRNAQDQIYQSGGDQLLLNAIAAADGSYIASFPIALDLSDAAVGASDHNPAAPFLAPGGPAAFGSSSVPPAPGRHP